MNVFILVHEFRDGYQTYAFTTSELRERAAQMLRDEYRKDFERDHDFLLFDDITLDEMPWARQGVTTNAKV